MNKERNDGREEGRGGLTNRSALATGGGGGRDGGDCASTHNFYLSLVRSSSIYVAFRRNEGDKWQKKRARRDVGERACGDRLARNIQGILGERGSMADAHFAAADHRLCSPT